MINLCRDMRRRFGQVRLVGKCARRRFKFIHSRQIAFIKALHVIFVVALFGIGHTKVQESKNWNAKFQIIYVAGYVAVLCHLFRELTA